MGSLPTGSDDVVNVATPLDTVELPSTVAPLVKDTVPVAFADKVSVKVTELPTTDGLSDEVSVDVGAAFVTVWVTVPTAEL